jgi:hypothetical protein
MSPNRPSDRKDPGFIKIKPRQIKRCLFKSSRWLHDGQFEAAVVVNLDTGIYYVLNRTVEKIWMTINGKRTVNAISAKMAKTFRVKGEKILPDIVKTLRMLSKAGLIRLQ